MKTETVVRKLKNALDLEHKKKKKDALKAALKKLKKKKTALKAKLEGSSSTKDKKKLKTALSVIKAQRAKGIKALREIQGKE